MQCFMQLFLNSRQNRHVAHNYRQEKINTQLFKEQGRHQIDNVQFRVQGIFFFKQVLFVGIMWPDKSSRFCRLQRRKAISDTMDEDGSEVERWSWLSSCIKQSSSQNIYAANRHPCPPTHPPFSQRIGISNFKPPSGQIPAQENPKLKCPDVLKAHVLESKHVILTLFLFCFLVSLHLVIT